MNILIVPNAFKESLEAEKVACAIRNGLKLSGLYCICNELPIADGGDGSLGVINQYLGAELFELEVNGPVGWHVMAKYGWQKRSEIGVVELAEASGIRHLHADQLDPWNASTVGTGQLIRELVEMGAKTIYLTVGGSATVDGALGILSALGTRFYHSKGQLTQPLTADLHKIVALDVSETLALLKDTSITILCDVINPLLGPHGAATVFGPQKGAKPNDIAQLEEGFANLAAIIARDFMKDIGDLPHAGAAGGVAGVLHGVLGSELVNGGKQILEWAGFEEALEKADVVITGEGKIDEQTAYGKGPGLVAKLAKDAGKYVIGISGSVSAEPRFYENFDIVLPIINAPGSIVEIFNHTAENLERTAMMIGRMLSR